jgi:DNA-binding NarL/FixJ family response regulator
MTSVLVADDQELVRAGLRTILERRDGIEVLGEAADGREAVREARRLRPDVVLMDVRMPGLDGIAATRELAGSPCRVLMLTTFDLDEYVYDALRAGASGFLLKDAPPDRLVEAIRAVAAGDVLLAPSITRRLVERYAGGPGAAPAPGLDELTAREREVLVLIARGLSNTEIAAELVVSMPTVKTHVGRVFLKLGLRDRAQAVIVAYEAGLVRAGDDHA